MINRHQICAPDLLQKLNRFLPLRHRYVLTRHNTLRLRYVVLPGGSFAGLALVIGAMVSPVLPGMSANAAYQVAGLNPVILGAENNALFENDLSDQLTVTQKRLKRSSTELDIAERLAMLDPAGGIGSDRLDDPVPAPRPVAAAATQEKTVKIGAGDTLTGVLNKAGLTNAEAYQVAQAMKKHVDPRTLKPGQTLNVRFDRAGDANPNMAGGVQFAALNMAVDALRTVSVTRQSGADAGYNVDLHEKEISKNIYVQEAVVENSLFGSAAKAGLPKAVVSDAIRIYSWDIDFQRDIRQGDRLQVMYEQFETEDGTKIKTGNILYAKLTIGGVEIPIYRHEMKDGRVDYFQQNGRSIRKALMKTPVDGARVSSGFGMRRHPIQGYNKMHKGIDFAAPTGTPIYAAGDGVIQKSGRMNGYGNYVRIRHNGQLSTAYAHMSRIAKGMANGKRVKQGELIGYVGSTGASTGPHLHYEVLVNGVQVNPRGLNLPTGEILEGDSLKVFQAHARQVDRDFNANRTVRTAQNVNTTTTDSADVR